MRWYASVLVCLLAHAATRPSLASELVQVREDFSNDPGWDHYQNRIVGVDMPEVIQDFGWRRTSFTGSGPGEIGGRVENSRCQAYYALPLGRPLTFNDELSASGKLALRHIGLRGVGYIGFFNSRRHTWRVWSSMAFRVWEEDALGQVMFDWMSSDWQARGAETAILLKPDGKVHTWSFRYEPEAKADPTWHDKALERHVTDHTGNGAPYELQGEEHLFARMKQEEPGLSREELHRRLLKARDQGLIEYFHRHDQHRWWKRPDAGQGTRPRHLAIRRSDALRLLVRQGDPASARGVRSLRPVQYRAVRPARGDLPGRSDRQRPAHRPVAGSPLGRAEQSVAVHGTELPSHAQLRMVADELGGRENRRDRRPLLAAPSPKIRSFPTTATTWAS